MTRSRKECLAGNSCEPASPAEAFCCLIQHSALDVEALRGQLAAQFGLRVSRAYLYELSNPHHGERGARVLAIAAALSSLTHRPVLLRFLCRLNGGEFIQLPTMADPGLADARLAADTLREFSEAMQAFADGSADQQWTAPEVARLEREGHDAIERILQIVEHARRCAAELPAKARGMAKATLDAPARKAVGQ